MYRMSHHRRQDCRSRHVKRSPHDRINLSQALLATLPGTGHFALRYNAEATSVAIMYRLQRIATEVAPAMTGDKSHPTCRPAHHDSVESDQGGHQNRTGDDPRLRHCPVDGLAPALLGG